MIDAYDKNYLLNKIKGEIKMTDQNQNTSDQEKKSGPSVGMIVGIILLIVAIFAMGFFVLSNMNTVGDPDQLPEEDPPVTLPVETPED